MSKRASGCNPDAAGLNKAIRKTENQGKCAGEQKSAWTRLKRRDLKGITPRGLALNKNR